MAEENAILVVDDDPQVRTALSRLLRTHGYRPVVAATAEEALALAQGGSFRAVISDVLMPGIGGIALLQRLDPLQPKAQFLMLSGAKNVETDSLPRGHGLRIFAKPWRPQDLVAALSAGVGNRLSSLPPAGPASARRTSRVLLVEDVEADAVLFKAALRMAAPGEFEVTVAGSLAAARQFLAQQQFDVICADLNLPDSVGLQTVVRLQTESPESALVVLSSSSDSELGLQSVRAGAHDSLVKGEVGGGSLIRTLKHAVERKEAESRLANMALTDQLTGLANRTLFRQHIAQSLARSRRSASHFAVLMLDLDRFKSINDALGHDAGDVFLQEVARRLRESTRETDTVARLGGDEFAILAEPVEGPEGVALLAQRILESVRASFELGGTTVQSSASIGVAFYPESGEDGDTLLSAADAAMYVAKAEGRDAFHVHGRELTRRVAQRLELEGKARIAVAQELFSLNYQPQVGVRDAFFGAEALLRWNDTGAFVATEEFIPILEDTGLFQALGPWLFRTACRQLRDWRQSGLHINQMAVNLSARQLVDGDIRGVVRSAIREFGLVPSDIELELTESTLISDSDTVLATLTELRRDGFRIALDDFGTGYCSLSYLRRFPITTVKIDKSYVSEIATDERLRDLLGGMIHLARRLGLSVVAEGVETTEQSTVLSMESCDIFQGYLFGRPTSGTEFQRSYLEAQSNASWRASWTAKRTNTAVTT